MLFSQPIQRKVPPVYAEGSSLASVRDTRNVATSWKKNKTVSSQTSSDNNVLASMQQQLNKLKRRQLGYMASQSAFFPFKIYNINNVSNPSLSSFTIQIRSGQIAMRSAYKVDYPLVANNSEQPMDCLLDNTPQFDSQPTALTGGNITLDNLVDTLIYDSGPLNLQVGNTKQIVFDGTSDIAGSALSSYWIEVIDTAAAGATQGLSFKLWGRMFQIHGDAPPARQETPFPTASASIIPLGIVTCQLGTIISIEQFVSSNLINRYPQSPLNSKCSTAGFLRGAWTADSLSGQVFWPGDLVVNDSAILQTIAGINFYGVYSYKIAPAIVAVAPVAGATWALSSVIIL